MNVLKQIRCVEHHLNRVAAAVRNEDVGNNNVLIKSNNSTVLEGQCYFIWIKKCAQRLFINI